MFFSVFVVVFLRWCSGGGGGGGVVLFWWCFCGVWW